MAGGIGKRIDSILPTGALSEPTTSLIWSSLAIGFYEGSGTKFFLRRSIDRFEFSEYVSGGVVSLQLRSMFLWRDGSGFF